MLTFCYRKTDAAAFISHIDTLRAIIRTIRRAGITVSYSTGFNPHMNLYMSPPMPLGFESYCEYCTADTEALPKDFYSAFNNHCIKGMECTAVYKVSKNPNIAAAAYSAEYQIKGVKNDNFESLKSGGEFIVTYVKDGKTVSKNVAEDILTAEKTNGGLKAVLKFGNMGNLRIDRFLETSGNDGAQAVKTALFCNYKGKVYNAEEYINLFLG